MRDAQLRSERGGRVGELTHRADRALALLEAQLARRAFRSRHLNALRRAGARPTKLTSSAIAITMASSAAASARSSAPWNASAKHTIDSASPCLTPACDFTGAVPSAAPMMLHLARFQVVITASTVSHTIDHSLVHRQCLSCVLSHTHYATGARCVA